MNALVLAYGNPLREDDGFGPAVAEALTGYALPPGTVVETCYQLLPEVADDLGHFDFVVFVDIEVDEPPGELHVAQVAPGPARDLGLGHRLDPHGVLALARDISGQTPTALTVTVTSTAFDYGDRLSSAVHAMVPQAAAAIARMLWTAAEASTPPASKSATTTP